MMALYAYEAFSKEGKRVKGRLDAATQAQVKELLVRQELFPIKIELAALESNSFFGSLFVASVTSKDKILFTKQLATLLKAGVPLLQSMELIIEQFSGALKSMLIVIKDDLRQGSSLASGLAKYPRDFEAIYVQLVRAGEASGQLETILERLTEYLERQEEIKKKIGDAVRGPLIQLTMILLVLIGMLVYVVPQLAENFTSQGKALPIPTVILLAISNIMMHHYGKLALIIGAIYGVYKYWSSTPKGARQIDTIKLHLPFIKYLSKTNAVVQFSYTLGMLLEGGVHLAESLDIVVKIINNRILADGLMVARDKIVKQGKIAQYLKQTNIFPPIAIYLIETGEQSGQLDVMLLNVAKTYEKEVGELIDSLTDWLNPLMLGVMGLIVGFIVLAIALPMIKMGDIAGI